MPNKDYEPSLIQNTIQEQTYLKQLARIIVNLKEKSESFGDNLEIPKKSTIESLLNVKFTTFTLDFKFNL